MQVGSTLMTSQLEFRAKGITSSPAVFSASQLAIATAKDASKQGMYEHSFGQTILAMPAANFIPNAR